MSPAHEQHSLKSELASIVGSDHVADDDFALWAVTNDSSPFQGKMPGVIVLPETTDEVSEIIKLANLTSTPVIPRGGGASLFGFPTGIPGRNIVLQLTRMNKLIEINHENMTVTAQGGMTTGELSYRCWEEGLHVHTVHTPMYTDTIGGLLTGAGGGGFPMEAASAGCIWQYVHGLEVVLPDGQIINTGAGQGTNVFRTSTFDRVFSAPDMTGMFIGDGGIFGVKTEVTMQLFPKPEILKSCGFIFATVDELWDAISKLSAIEPFPYDRMYGIGPEGFNDHTGNVGEDWGLLLGVVGYNEEEVDFRLRTLNEVSKKSGGMDLPEGYEVILTDLDKLDPESHRNMGKRSSMGQWVFMEEFFEKDGFLDSYKATRDFANEVYKKENLEKYGCRRFDCIIPFGHNSVYLGNNIFYDQSFPEAREKILKIVKDHTDFVTRLGASMDVHEGYAAEVMASYWSPSFYGFMKTLKKTLDPNNILNPGLWKL
jgi:FAD/FMN-containing dehydrogenase